MFDVECPYCGNEQEINHDDGYGYDEDETYQQECSSCEKTFAFTTGIIFVYEANQARCLNGGLHTWHKSMATYPAGWFYTYCEDCGEEHRWPQDNKLAVNPGVNP